MSRISSVLFQHLIVFAVAANTFSQSQPAVNRKPIQPVKNLSPLPGTLAEQPEATMAIMSQASSASFIIRFMLNPPRYYSVRISARCLGVGCSGHLIQIEFMLAS